MLPCIEIFNTWQLFCVNLRCEWLFLPCRNGLLFDGNTMVERRRLAVFACFGMVNFTIANNPKIGLVRGVAVSNIIKGQQPNSYYCGTQAEI